MMFRIRRTLETQQQVSDGLERDALVERIKVLHQPEWALPPVGQTCSVCFRWGTYGLEPMRWPCPTVAALAAPAPVPVAAPDEEGTL